MDRIKTPAMHKVLTALAAPGTRWHSPAALMDATGLTLPAVGNALAQMKRWGWVVDHRPSPKSWARDYSITTTGDQARQEVEQLSLAGVQR